MKDENKHLESISPEAYEKKISELQESWDKEVDGLANEIAELQGKLDRAIELLTNLVYTASILWDAHKTIKDTPAMTVTHPTIEEAKTFLKEQK